MAFASHLKNATVDKHLPSFWVVKTYLGIPKVGPRLISDPEATEMRNECEVETLQLEEPLFSFGHPRSGSEDFVCKDWRNCRCDITVEFGYCI